MQLREIQMVSRVLFHRVGSSTSQGTYVRIKKKLYGYMIQYQLLLFEEPGANLRVLKVICYRFEEEEEIVILKC